MGEANNGALSARLATLAGGTLVALASGTNYVYSAYAPQLAARIKINHTQLNVVGLAGNIGVYLSGPFWGRLADKKGPRILFACAFVLLFVGYNAIHYFYLYGSAPISGFGFFILAMCSTFTGVGGNAGITGAMNANAKSWPDSRRATANGIVISGFGLSAFFFSTLATLFFHGDPSSLLLLLAFGTALPMILGFFVVRPILLPAEESPESALFPDTTAAASEILYSAVPEDDAEPEESDELHKPAQQVRDTSRTRLVSRESSSAPSQRYPPYETAHSDNLGTNVDLHGKAMFQGVDFWLLFIPMFLLSGTGLMYINNVGSMVQALLAHDNPEYDPAEGLKDQAIQVSNISLFNFLGRLAIGIIADTFKHRFGYPRAFAMIIVAAGFILSQLITYHIEDIQHLWKASMILGLSYGMLFGLYPTVVIEWFGLSHFSENWGFVALAPAFGGNLFSLLFGKNLDAHDPHDIENLGTSTAFSDASHQCLEGRFCYVDTLRLTTLACSIALCMSIYASWKDWRRVKAQRDV